MYPQELLEVGKPNNVVGFVKDSARTLKMMNGHIRHRRCTRHKALNN